MFPIPRNYVYLDAVARSGSIRKAAESLHVASTALNRKIIELENDIGTPLFERLPRGVRLTSAGELLVGAVRRGIADLRSTASQIEQLSGLVRGTVRVGCAESVASGFVPQAITEFHSHHPGVQFRITSGVTNDLTEALLCDEVEVILVHDPRPTESLRVVTSIPQKLCALMRPDHPLANRSSLRLVDCEPFPVALGDPSFKSRQLLQSVTAQTKMTLQVVMEANTVQSLKDFTQLSGAISFQYRIGAMKEVEDGALVAIPLNDRAFAFRQLVLATRSDRVLPVATLAFVEKIAARLMDVKQEQ
jgi:DNA-binding transcriptional LysR family regulator